MIKKLRISLANIGILAFVFLQTAEVKAQLPAGTLDTTFSTDGKVLTPVTAFNNEGRAVAIQADGKIVVAGNASGGTLNNFGIVRYNNDGSLDNTFGTSGIVTTTCGPGNNVARAIAIQADGKIVVAGNNENQTYSRFAVARYTTSGALDNTFGSGGKVLTALDLAFDLAYAVAIQADGKIVVAGVSYDTLANGEFGVVRYNTNGTLDNTFGIGGKIRTSLGTPWDQAQSIAIQPDGKILVGGRTYTQMALVRYTASGMLDATFASGGIMTLAIGANSDVINAVKLKPDGRILAGGVTQSGNDYNFMLVQFDNTGNLDPAFGLSGLIISDFGGTDIIYAMAVDANENIIAAGSSGPATGPEFTIARYDSIGNSDYTFNNQGFLTTSFGTTSSGANAVAIQSDGKIVAAGSAMSGTTNTFAVARYFPDPIFVGVPEFLTPASLALTCITSSQNIVVKSTNQLEKLQVFNLSGKEILLVTPMAYETEVSTHQWAKGVYFIKGTSGKETATCKIVVNH